MLLGGRSDIDVVAEAADGDEAIRAVDAHWPDVILMDIRMPRLDGITATRRIRARASAPHVIVLTTFNADDYVLEALRGGASGFLLKDTPPQEIIAAVLTVAAGAGSLSPSVIKGLIDYLADPEAGSRRTRAREKLDILTEREREVAVALGQGWTNPQIGQALGMAVPTAKEHVSNVLAKLGLNNRVQVAVLVHDAELL
jgi:DNA-binding NarL/FixJ family response regulator